MATLLRKFVTFLAALLVTIGGFYAFDSGVAYAERSPGGLPANAPKADRKFQPATDYDEDGCYPTPAIGPDGKLNPGKRTLGDVNGECHDKVDLKDANIYSRSRCNNGWCAYMYAYYFEKDQVSNGFGVGHRHDWENVVVWVHNHIPKWVSVSQHGGYEIFKRKDVRWQGTHAKVVYHKDETNPGGTHAFRHATSGDEPPENDTGKWHLPKVIGWSNYPPGFRKKIVNHYWGAKPTFPLKDSEDTFENSLMNAKPSEVTFDPKARNVKLKNLGNLDGPRFLDGRTRNGTVRLAPRAKGENYTGTKWELRDLGNNVVTLKNLGNLDGPKFLDGRTRNGTVRLAPRTKGENYTGTKWKLKRLRNKTVTLKSLGNLDGPRFLDGRTRNGTVRLAPRAKGENYTGTKWRIDNF